MTAVLLATVAAAVLLGVAGQALSSLTRVPAIVFLPLLGVAAGPFGLPVVTSALLAVILFEGSLTLRPELLRQALHPTRRLITWGAVMALAGAAAAGLKPGDVIIGVYGRPVNSFSELQLALLNDWPRGEEEVRLTVERGGERVELPPYEPRSLHPTQIYESVSMALLFLVLIAYYPLRRHHGQLMVLLMLGYSVHRFLNEQLRNDTDPVALGLTLSQLGSVLVFAGAVALEAIRRLIWP